MAKLRVYELAKELKIDNKDLVRQLVDLGFDVRNHMSVLSDDEASSAREKLQAALGGVVEDKRLTTKVIRRRRITSEDQASEQIPEADAVQEAEASSKAEEAQASPEAESLASAAASASPKPETAAKSARSDKAFASAKVIAPAPRVSDALKEDKPSTAIRKENVTLAEHATLEPISPAPVEPRAQDSIRVVPTAEAAQAPAEGQVSSETALQREAKAAEVKVLDPTVEKKASPRPPASAASSPAAAMPGKSAPAAYESQRSSDFQATARQQARNRSEAKPRRPQDQPARIISRPNAAGATGYARPQEQRGDYEARPQGERGDHRPQEYSRPAGSRVSVQDVPPPEKRDDRNRPRRKKGKKTETVPDAEFLLSKGPSRRKEIFDKADLYDSRGTKGRRRGSGTVKKIKKTELTTPKAIKRRIKVGETIAVGELSKRMGVKSAELVRRLMEMGMPATINEVLELDDATLVAAEFGFEVERASFEEEGLLEQMADKPEELETRAPVVTIMGHVDHGKTSLLDAIRRSDVVAGEAGGITQHIGAYDVHLPNGGRVVFVDTPGHAAFTQMRARGAQVTDVVVLVVAADDGVMQQTKEAINHSKAAGVPIVVAINKIDKPGADAERVRRELSELGLVPEEWGGDTIMLEVSAKQNIGVDALLEMLQLQSEVLELKANPHKPARGRILEARLDKGRGAVATVLVQEGTLKSGDFFVCGAQSGKVRAIFDDLGRRLDEAGPSTPVEVQGLDGVPEAGDEFAVVESEKVARQIAAHRSMKKREIELLKRKKTTLAELFEQMKEGVVQELKLVVKADMHGSMEALVESLGKLGNDQVKVNVIHSGAGAITETDVMLASASNAIVIGFNVRPTGKAIELAEAEHVEIRTYDIIYQILDDVTAALTGLLAPILEEEVIGRAEVRDVFSVPKVGAVAGCGVTSGKIERNAQARLIREGIVIVTTKISSLRRFKDDVKEVLQGFECGIGLENYNDIKVGDEIEAFVTRERAAKL